MAVKLKPIHDAPLRAPGVVQDNTTEVWKEICGNTARELAVGLAIAAATAPFMTSVGTGWVVAKTINIVSSSLIRRGIAVYNRHNIEQLERMDNKDSFTNGRLLVQKTLNTYLNWTNAYRFTKLTDNADTLVHEVGHYTLFKMLCKGSAGIEVFPFSGGVTSWTFERFTALGAYLGDETVVKLIFAAGVGFSLTASLVCIAAAHYYKDTKPELSRYLNAAAVQCIFSASIYAMSALWDDSPGHDFAVLASVGISPFTSMRTILGIPLAFKLGLNQLMTPQKNLRPMGEREVRPGKLRKGGCQNKAMSSKKAAGRAVAAGF